MELHRKTALTFAALACLTALPALSKEMTAEERQLKAKHVAKLGPRHGYGNKVWDEFVRMAPEYEDEQILGALFSAQVEQGHPLVRKRVDLLTVFKAKPAFFVGAGTRFYGGDSYCLLFWLVPSSGVIDFREVDGALGRAIAQDPSNGELAAFRTQAKAWHATLKSADSAGAARDCTKRGSKPRSVDND
jgi:hypothetical protein